MQTKQDVETVSAQLSFGIASLFPQDSIEAILLLLRQGRHRLWF